MSTSLEEIRRLLVRAKMRRLRDSQDPRPNRQPSNEEIALAEEINANNRALVEETPFPALVGAGRAFTEMGQGIAQTRAMISGDSEEFQRIARESQLGDETFNIIKEQSPSAELAEFGTRLGVPLVVPGGASGNIARRLAGGAAAGTVVGATEPAQTESQKAEQLLFGSLGGAAGGGMGRAIEGTTGVREVAHTRLMAQAEEDLNLIGILTAGEMRGSTGLIRIEAMMDNIPFIGTAPRRVVQRDKFEDRANQLVDSLDPMLDEPVDPETVIKFLNEAEIAARDRVSQAYDEVAEAARNRLYPLPEDAIRVEFNNSQKAARELLDAELSLPEGQRNSEIISLAESWLENDPVAFSVAQRIDSRLGQDARLASRRATSGEHIGDVPRAFGIIRSAYAKDLEAWANKMGGDVMQKYQATKQLHLDTVVPFSRKPLKQIMGDDFDPASLTSGIVGAARPSTRKASAIIDNNTFEGQQAFRFLIINEAFDRSIRDGNFNPLAFARELEKLRAVNKVAFDPSQQRVIRGMVRLQQAAERASRQGSNVLATLGVVSRVRQILLTASGTKWLLTTPAGRSILTSASKTDLSPAQIERLMSQASILASRSLALQGAQEAESADASIRGLVGAQ